jgi:Tol biopolymer transport system component
VGDLTDAAFWTALADRYVPEGELGRGGMATVYLARDLRHRRQVALKVLHPELSSVLGPERFLQEIELTAKLQHPHILPLFDSGSANGLLYYVMPRVEGETLRRRLERERQLPVGDAVRIATEVADALGYAHRHGVIHRDIKPENILLQDGRPLVADFGIALAVQEAGGSRLTRTGVTVGTPHYMAPEQATGEPIIDQRVDVYALGAVLYEMLVGEPPFTGPTAQYVVGRMMTEEPKSPSARRRSVPGNVDSAVMTALEKLPADRFATAGEFAAALGTPGADGARREGRRQARPWIPALVGAAAALAGFALGRITSSTGPARLSAFGRNVQVTSEPGLEIHPALSPDGRTVAYTAGRATHLRVFVRPTAGGRALALTADTTELQTNPTWSPDGGRVLYLARGGVFSAPATGGPEHQELPAGRDDMVNWAALSPDGHSLGYAIADSLFIRDPAGQSRRVATMVEPSLCAWSPDGSEIACAAGNSRYATGGLTFANRSPSWIVLCSLKNATLTDVTGRTSLNHSPEWSPDGRSLYFVSDRDGVRDVYVQGMSADGKLEGKPARITTGLNPHSISVSADGKRLAYVAFNGTGNVWSLPATVDTPVSVSAATPITSGNQVIETIYVSPDEHWLYYDSNLGGHSDIYRVALPQGEAERLTTDPADDFAPQLSPNGREVAFHSWRSGSRDIYVMPLDGGPVQRVTSSPRQEWLASWSPDGSALAFGESSPTGALWIVHRNPDGTWRKPVERSDSGGQWATWSPDGRWIAYSNDPLSRSGRLTVIPVDSGPSRVLEDPARPRDVEVEQAQWSGDGKSVLFKSHDAAGNASIWSVPLLGGERKLRVRFDDPARPSYRTTWWLGKKRIYFTVEDRQSDVWVMEAANN